MTTVSEKQANERWDTLPLLLRQNLTSGVNSDFIWKKCEAEHIPNEKIYFVGRAVSHVLYGFTHPGDLAQEIKEVANIDPKLSASIANAINERIFKPLAADLEKIYEPPVVSRAEPPSALSPHTTPKPFVLEVKPTAPPLVKTESPKPLAASEFDKRPTASIATPQSGDKTKMANPFQIKLTDVPSVKTEIKPGVPLPPGSRSSTDFTKASSAQVELSLPGKPPTILRPEIGPEIRTSEPPPIIIHEEPSLSPLKSAKEFRIDIPQPKLSEMKLNIPPRPAVLEFGVPFDAAQGKPQPSAAKSIPTQPSTPQFNPSRAESSRTTQPVPSPAVRPSSPQMPQPSQPKINAPVPRPIEVPALSRVEVPKPPAAPERKREKQIFRPTRPMEINLTEPPPANRNNSFTQNKVKAVRPSSPQEEKVKIVHYSEFTTQPEKPSSTPSSTMPPKPPAPPK